MLVVLDVCLVVHYFQTHDESGIVIATRIMAGISTIAYSIRGILLLKKFLLKKFFVSTMRKAGEIYFHGFKLQHYIDSWAFLRLEEWLGTGMCYELSILAMILLEDNKSARLCRGKHCYKDGRLRTRHSWVEVKVPLNGWIVIDFAWGAFCKKRDYYSHLNKGGKFVCEWTCPHDDFWKIRFTHVISEAMKNMETSCVLLELSVFGDAWSSYNFDDCIYEIDKLMLSDGSLMVPHHRAGTGRPVSTRIIRDFVKKTNRRKPKAKSIRLAYAGIRKYESWKAQQATSAHA